MGRVVWELINQMFWYSFAVESVYGFVVIYKFSSWIQWNTGLVIDVQAAIWGVKYSFKNRFESGINFLISLNHGMCFTRCKLILICAIATYPISSFRDILVHNMWGASPVKHIKKQWLHHTNSVSLPFSICHVKLLSILDHLYESLLCFLKG